MKISLLVLLAVTVAQLPSCGSLSGPDTIVGYVEEKMRLPLDVGGGTKPYILIGGTDYEVPMEFWMQVRVGDLVKRENGIWTIVRRSGTT
jgi:hypothetical protein